MSSDNFVADSKAFTKKYSEDLTSKIMSLTKNVGEKKKEYENSKTTVRNNPVLQKHYDLDAIKAELEAMEDDLEKLSTQKANLKQSILTYSQYLELFKNISVKLRKKDDMAVYDQVLKNSFQTLQ